MKSILNKMDTGRWRIFNSQFSIFNCLTALCIFAGVCASCNEDEEGGVRELVLNQTELGIARESEETLIATAVPFKAKTGIVWTSSDESIATVIDGTVQAKALGKVIISAVSTVNPNIKATCEVTVGPVFAKDIELDFSGGILYVDSIKTIGAVIKPSNVDDASIVWTSSDENVVSVDQGIIKGISPGESDITITSGDGVYTTTIHLIVETYIPVTSIETDNTLRLMEGMIKQIVATVEPFNASRPALTWTSSNPEVARVDSTGRLECILEGTTTVTITTADQVTATVNVEVRYLAPPDIVMNGYAGAKIEALFEDGTKKTHEFEYELGFYLDAGDRDKIIRTVTLEDGTELLIGRSVQTQLRMMFNGYVFVFRNADDDGFIPIGTIAELHAVRWTPDGSFRLTSDLDFNNGEGMTNNTWQPISAFTGVFDGDGHKLSNVRIASTAGNVALFATLSGGTLRNLHIASGSISAGGNYSAGFVGTASANAVISGCSTNANITSTSGYPAGICSFINGGATISQCYNTGNIVSPGRTGGIVSYINTAGNVIECYNTGNITATAGDRFGGILGMTAATTAASTNIIACYNTGTIIGRAYTGGVAGDPATAATFTECYNTGSVSSATPASTGWFVGRAVAATVFNGCFYSSVGSAADVVRACGTPATGINVGMSFGDSWPSWSLKSSGGHWKSLGSRESETFPQLWYE
jgi:uncharacterized protein YjdB